MADATEPKSEIPGLYPRHFPHERGSDRASSLEVGDFAGMLTAGPGQGRNPEVACPSVRLQERGLTYETGMVTVISLEFAL